MTDSGDTLETLKREMTENETENIKVKNLVIDNLSSSLQEAMKLGDYDADYYTKAAVEMDYRLTNGNPNGKYAEPSQPNIEEPITPKAFKRKSRWQMLKENLKKIMF